MAATGNFINNSGSATPITATSGKIYSTSPASNIKGGMVPAFSVFNCTYPAGCGAPATGIGFLYTQATAPTLTIIADAVGKTYGSADPALTYAVSGLVGDDLASIVTGAQSRIAGENVGTYAVSQGALADGGYGYTLSYTGNNLTITPASLTVTANAATKTYDGLAYTGGNGVAYSGFVNGETNAVLGGTLAYSGSSQGAINAGGYVITPGGLSSSNYTIGYVDGILTINPAPLNVISLSGTRVYDGTVNVAASIFTLSGLVGGQTLNLTGVGTVADKNVGANKTVTLGSLALSDGTGLASNYTFTGGTHVATITPLALTGAAIAGVNTTYGTPATTGAVTFGNIITGDAVTSTASINGQTLSSSGNLNAGSYTQTAGALGGADAGNYSFAGYTSAANYTVGQLALTGTIATGSSTYGSTLSPGATSFTNAVAGDNLGTVAVAVNTAGNLSSSGNLNAGSYSGIETVSALSGTDAANYTFAGVTGNYTVGQLALTGAAIAGVNTTYGTPATTGAVAFGNIITGDAVTSTASINGQMLSSSGNLNAGSYTQTAGALGGADAGNYSFAGYTTPAASYTVAQATLIIGATGVNRIYDGSTIATVTLGDNRIAGDILTTGYVAASFLDKNAAIGKTVSVSGITLAGLDAGNYTFNTTSSATADITKAVLTVYANTTNKILNTSDPLLTYSVSGLMPSDTEALIMNGGSLTRDAGEAVGIYQIDKGSLALTSTNYTMSYIPASFTILAPTVIDEMTNTSLLLGTPETGSAQGTSSDEEDPKPVEVVVAADTSASAGTAAQPLPVCQ
ncbi:MAG: hypothetical protein HY935_01140 [Nitrosomonadales bacterium]|nr:hypothetical protein [Nitrosomonadales bacterium]